jgi:hypothetical protein
MLEVNCLCLRYTLPVIILGVSLSPGHIDIMVNVHHISYTITRANPIHSVNVSVKGQHYSRLAEYEHIFSQATCSTIRIKTLKKWSVGGVKLSAFMPLSTIFQLYHDNQF